MFTDYTLLSGGCYVSYFFPARNPSQPIFSLAGWRKPRPGWLSHLVKQLINTCLFCCPVPKCQDPSWPQNFTWEYKRRFGKSSCRVQRRCAVSPDGGTKSVDEGRFRGGITRYGAISKHFMDSKRILVDFSRSSMTSTPQYSPSRQTQPLAAVISQSVHNVSSWFSTCIRLVRFALRSWGRIWWPSSVVFLNAPTIIQHRR